MLAIRMIMMIYINEIRSWLFGWLFGFYGISTFVSYLTPYAFFLK